MNFIKNNLNIKGKEKSVLKENQVKDPFTGDVFNIDTTRGKELKDFINYCERCPHNRVLYFKNGKCIDKQGRVARKNKKMKKIIKFCNQYDKGLLKTDEKPLLDQLYEIKIPGLPGKTIRVKDLLQQKTVRFTTTRVGSQYDFRKVSRYTFNVFITIIIILFVMAQSPKATRDFLSKKVHRILGYASGKTFDKFLTFFTFAENPMLLKFFTGNPLEKMVIILTSIWGVFIGLFSGGRDSQQSKLDKIEASMKEKNFTEKLNDKWIKIPNPSAYVVNTLKTQDLLKTDHRGERGIFINSDKLGINYPPIQKGITLVADTRNNNIYAKIDVRSKTGAIIQKNIKVFPENILDVHSRIDILNNRIAIIDRNLMKSIVEDKNVIENVALDTKIKSIDTILDDPYFDDEKAKRRLEATRNELDIERKKTKTYKKEKSMDIAKAQNQLEVLLPLNETLERVKENVKETNYSNINFVEADLDETLQSISDSLGKLSMLSIKPQQMRSNVLLGSETKPEGIYTTSKRKQFQTGHIANFIDKPERYKSQPNSITNLIDRPTTRDDLYNIVEKTSPPLKRNSGITEL